MWKILTPEIRNTIHEDEANLFIVKICYSSFEQSNITHFQISVPFLNSVNY